MKHATISRLIFSLAILSFALAGCAPNALALSPQQSAIRALSLGMAPNVVIDQNTIEIRQSVQVGNKIFILISFSEMEGAQKGKCLFMAQVEQTGVGVWRPNNSGGGCTMTGAGSEPPPEPAMEVNGGRGSSSSAKDPGYSNVHGLVNQPDIARVRVTWKDGQQQEVDVINSTYLAVRAGRLSFQKVEGLNSAGDAVYTNEPETGPGME